MNQTPIIAIRGAGDLATGIAMRLYRAGLRRIIMLETGHPLAVRRTVAFSEAVYHGEVQVEGVSAVFTENMEEAAAAWDKDAIAILCDPCLLKLDEIKPEILIDAIIAKKNLGTEIHMAPLVIGLGPGFTAGENVHKVIETKRGHHMSRVIHEGAAEPNTGIPGSVKGFTVERVYWAENGGVFNTTFDIGDEISEGETLGDVDGTPVVAKISGVIRGLLRNGTPVRKRTKLGDIDPRATKTYCGEVSDKALSIGGGVLEAVCAHIFSKD
ncbi:selenium-dependent molybdenum cofactor biosynthesis protein YqeB [Desulfovibrio sp. JC022]|uniref:selenium-dependent molybdenum cofactor biosynthesis protein YqeB n=1 Tax=Desulfovibrio sp. JC022 TaxID=2593642 RepID=UPI0013CFEF85|nr:selenium-dependent molybdenum cofactor biosynthesis protein YqeB [Desulfovibrio sp. JC022]NDV24296.1 EF2563 family selenium-dependent molybdenum hydroxylase system protein [Desulfovibrio sp. JC022]